MVGIVEDKKTLRLLLAAYAVLVAGAFSVQKNWLPAEASDGIATPSPLPPDAHIYTWIGNTPEGNRKMHVSGYRMGCDSGDPRGCVREATDGVQQTGFKSVFLSMFVDAERTLDDAREYSRLSVSHPFIVEVGFDDFVDRYEKLFSRPRLDPPSWLREVIRTLKADNADLGFGITLYEDQLDSPSLRAPSLPPDLERSVDYVHLFLHYRSDASQLRDYVDRTKVLFPKAKIIAGLYAYDRVNYIPCSPSNQRACSPGEEIQLYMQAVNIDAQLLKEGSIDGIEFYPGFFGKEKEWGGWKNADYCSSKRVEECIENTRVMRQSTVEALHGAIGW